MLHRILTALNSVLATFLSRNMKVTQGMIHLINTFHTMSPKARKKLDEFLTIMLKEINNSH